MRPKLLRNLSDTWKVPELDHLLDWLCYVLKKARWGMQFHIIFIATSYTATGSYLLSALIDIEEV